MATHNIYVYAEVDGRLQRIKINPAVTVGAIIDLGLALDSYKEAFIDPDLLELDNRTRSLKLSVDNHTEIITSLEQNALMRTGGTMIGTIDMGNNPIIGLPAPIVSNEAANKKYVDDQVELFIGLGDSLRTYIDELVLSFAVEAGLIGDMLYYQFQGITTILYRIGNIVVWSCTGNANSSALGTIPSGFRPTANISFFSGQTQGSTQKLITINTSGATSCNLSLSGAIAFTTTWVSTEPFRTVEEQGR